MMSLRLLFIFLFLLLSAENLWAQKLSLGFGGYSINAKVGDTKTDVSNLGAYKIQYHSKVQDQFELLIGYSVIMEGIVSGDKAFGPFFGFSYYPFGSGTVSNTSVSNLSVLSIKHLNPYFSAGFNQRQYQSVKAAYSGFSFGGGVQSGWTKVLSLFADLQYGLLDGPNSGTATEISATVGIIYNY